MARQAQGWRYLQQEKVTKVTGSLLAMLSLALQFQPLVMVLFWGWDCLFVCSGSAASQKRMKCLIMSFAFKTDLSFVCKYKSNT